jgi:hypothetical protein
VQENLALSCGRIAKSCADCVVDQSSTRQLTLPKFSHHIICQNPAIQGTTILMSFVKHLDANHKRPCRFHLASIHHFDKLWINRWISRLNHPEKQWKTKGDFTHLKIRLISLSLFHSRQNRWNRSIKSNFRLFHLSTASTTTKVKNISSLVIAN